MLKKILKKKNLILIALIIPLYIYLKIGNTFVPIEDLAISSAIGSDIVESSDGTLKYNVTILLDNFMPTGEIVTQVLTASGSNYAQTRETRQHKLNRKLLPGIERVSLITENFGRFGIDSFIDLEFKNPLVNDSTYVVVCKQKPEEIFKVKIPGYPNIADYLKGIIDHSNEYNFSPVDYKLIDIYVGMAAEGRSVVLPYLEIINGELKLTGVSLFKGPRMVQKLDNEESKIMNLLRENNLRGLINLQDDPQKFLSYYGKSNRKVKCQRKNGKYTFTIDLSIKGDVVSNTLYEDFMLEKSVKEEAEKRLGEKIEKQCYDFIEKMQRDYKVDCLELGQIAAAKYGRNKGIDWDEVVSQSKIIVNAKVTVNTHGRGEY